MEKEFKWSMTGNGIFVTMLISGKLPPIENAYNISMNAQYYDTADGMVSCMRGGLRLRRENETSVCCLKLAADSSEDGACKSREEFECEAPDIEAGLHLLPAQAGAPAEICQAILGAGVTKLGQTSFLRQAALLNDGSCTAELACDVGAIYRNGKHLPICELELEYKSGDAAAFEALGRQLQEQFDLTPQPLSKLARMMML